MLTYSITKNIVLITPTETLILRIGASQETLRTVSIAWFRLDQAFSITLSVLSLTLTRVEAIQVAWWTVSIAWSPLCNAVSIAKLIRVDAATESSSSPTVGAAQESIRTLESTLSRLGYTTAFTHLIQILSSTE